MSRAKPRTRRNRPTTPPTPEQLAEAQVLRERILARLDVFRDGLIAQGWTCCPDCGGLDPPASEDA